MQEVDHGRGFLGEHDTTDDLHVGTPVLLGGRRVPGLDVA
jgi:hypothetical protein